MERPYESLLSHNLIKDIIRDSRIHELWEEKGDVGGKNIKWG